MASQNALLGLIIVSACWTTNALFGLEGAGGTFRYGHIFWKRIQGNEVEFTIQAAFTRSVDTSYFSGSALDGYSRTGDVITMTGRETPMFDFGDGFEQRLDKLEMTVIAYSVRENWFLGSTTLKGHVYPTPNNEDRDGLSSRPWLAKFTGCCRFGELMNNADTPWVLTAEVDLQRALTSPRVGILPQISVPSTAYKDQFTPDSVEEGPSFRVPGSAAVPEDSRCDRRVKFWELDKPWTVGTAARFKTDSSLQMDLSSDHFSSEQALQCCTKPSQCSDDYGDNPSVSPGCFFRLLRSDHEQRALTVEGWVRISTESGGVVMKTGKKDGTTCADTDKGLCDVSLMQIALNATHVTVGHEVYDEMNNVWMLKTVSFAVNSNALLLADLNNEDYYSNPSDRVVDKWVHVAVVRQTRVKKEDSSFSQWFSTYKAYVNGQALELQTLNGCTKTVQSPECASRPGGAFYDLDDGGDSFDTGESNLLPGPRLPNPFFNNENFGRCDWDATWELCKDSFGSETTLQFGLFEGDLDEWRFWNGERRQTDVLSWFQKPLSPALSVYYGNPTQISGSGGIITKDNYKIASLLIANFNFDWDQSNSDSCASEQLVDGCAFTTLIPIFPVINHWEANTVNEVIFVETGTSRIMFYESGELFQLEAGGVIRFKQAFPIPVGMYQVTVRVAIDRDTPRVPVDFIVEVLNQDGFARDSDLRILGTELCTIPNQPCPYNPDVNQYAPTLSITGNIAAVPESDQGCPEVDDETNTAVFVKGGQPQGLLPVDDNVYPNYLRAYAGFEVALTFHGADSQPVPASGPDLVGFSIGPAPAYGRFSTVRGTKRANMTMQWTPCDANMTSILCVEAVDYHIDPVTNLTERSAASQSKCLAFEVEQDPPPVFLGPKMLLVNFTMGKPHSITLVARDANALDDIEIDLADGELPAGLTLMHADRDCLHCIEKSVTLAWTPGVNMGGFASVLRFRVRDSGGAVCSGLARQEDFVEVMMTVEKCKYMVQKDMQLQELAAVFDMDWIRLWSLNSMEPSLNHPDYLVLKEPPQVIHVGHRYRVLSGTEPLDRIVTRFGMSMEQLRQLNYDIREMEEVPEGYRLCVVPNSCKGLKDTIYSGLEYKDNKFLAQQGADASSLDGMQTRT
eukprot:CAMPEP_0181315814 /NCGR_PEP_ID=MMETSP1101-20121128/15571_1 /TAXON_ID=46948 /ORGANISM="Rhodomonas abbreviata, Strain Caron Lab Isolate" /LENGTH=1134 /DNA_ID=CAMNT_0023423037 /DNA_START=135 /DNA_END=3540 /DNA_ORIENTATION=+